MKLYTKPRLQEWWLLRPGDQIALGTRGRVIEAQGSYVDADLAGKVEWAVVHDVTGTVAEGLTIVHTLGESGPGKPSRLAIAREAIEIDPWSYIKAA